MQEAENLRAGLLPIEARRQALLKFGSVEAIKESYRDQRRLPFIETVLSDTRHALRRMHAKMSTESTTSRPSPQGGRTKGSLVVPVEKR